jgi:hypothetical protein
MDTSVEMRRKRLRNDNSEPRDQHEIQDRGGDAARATVATTERLPVPLQATDVAGPFQPMPEVGQLRKPARVRKPSAPHDVIHAPTTDLDAHRVMLRATFGTSSNEFADT